MRGSRAFLSILTALVAAMMLTACTERSASPGTDVGQASQSPQAGREYDLVATGAAAAELLGADGTAAYAVLKAFDSGYSPYQIAHAIEVGLIGESGDVEGLTPAWPRGNELASSHDGTSIVVAAVAAGAMPAVLAEAYDGYSSRSDFEQMFEQISDQGQSGRWLAWLLGATGSGYSVGQITEYLDENEPFSDLSPPTAFGVPIVVDGDGNFVDPGVPVDWPYKGRNVLVSLQRDQDLDFDDNLTVLIIGMVNAGYSPDQITAALKSESIGLCSTGGGSTDAEAFTACYVKGAEIVPPADLAALRPAEIQIASLIPDWPLKTTASPDKSSKLESGETISLKLTPYLPSPDTTLVITSHDIVMEIAPAGGSSSWYNISGSWTIELLETETDVSENRSHDKGERYILEGEFFSDGPTPLDRIYRLPVEYAYTAYTPTGEFNFEDRGSHTGFSGSLDADLEGDGIFGSIGPAQVNWDTYPVDE